MKANREHPAFKPVLSVLGDEAVAERVVEALRDHLARHTEMKSPTGLTSEPLESDETTAFSKVAMGAVIQKLKERPEGATPMNVSLVVTAPENLIAVATTEPEGIWTLEAFVLAAMSLRRQLRA